MLTDDQLDAMRETLEDSLPETASIVRLTTTATETGGASEAWTSIATGIAARISPEGGGEGVVADKLTSSRGWIVTLPHGTDVAQADRIVIGSRTFEVSHLKSARSYQVSVRVRCTEVE